MHKFLFGLFLLMLLSSTNLFGGSAWYELKDRPGANLYDIDAAVETELENTRDDMAQELTRILLADPALYELEKNFQYKRWKNYVEPRVAPSGNLDLLLIGQEENRKLLPLDGKLRTPSRGNWKPIGPYSSNTAGAGRLNWIEFHPTNTNIFMVGAASGGLWITKDAGNSWYTTTDDLMSSGAAWAVFDPKNPDIIYLGTGDNDANDSYSIGVLKSTDGGMTWNTTGMSHNLSDRRQIRKLLIHPTDTQKLFVAHNRGLSMTTNGGTSFTTVSGITGGVRDIEIHPTNPDILYASGTNFYRSTNGGSSFSRIPSIPSAGSRMLIEVTAAQPNYVYVLRGSSSSTQGVHRSTNSGADFTQTGTGSAIGCSQAWYDYAFGANPKNSNELMAGCLRIYRSTDGGANWSQAGTSYHVDIHGTVYHPNGTLYTVNDGGIWRSTGNTSWQNLNNNLNIGQSYRMGVFPTDYDRVCTGRQDNGTDIHANPTRGFYRALGADGFECFWNLTGDRFYGESQNGGFSRCTYNASSGTTSGCTSSIRPSASGSWDTPWSQDPKDNNTIYAGRGSSFYKSTNSGDDWTRLGTTGSTIRNFMVSPSNTQVIYASAGNNIYRSSNGGSTWSDVWTASGTPINLAIDAEDPNDVWTVVSGYSASNKIFHSTNGGQSWINETRSGIPNVNANCVALDPIKAGHVYLGTDNGVYFRNNSFNNWQNFSGGLPFVEVSEMEIAQKGTDANDRMLIAGTYGRGVWRTRLWDDVTAIKNTSKAVKLRRVFASKVSNHRLRIHFQLGEDAMDGHPSRVLLVNLKGEVLFSETVASNGAFDRQVDISKNANGIYFLVVLKGISKISRKISIY